MANKTVQVLGADGNTANVVLNITSNGEVPLYKPTVGADGDIGEMVSTDNPMPVDVIGINGKIDTGNSTSTPLIANDVFTGEPMNALDIADISIFVFTDQDSATNGLSIQWSADGANWDENDEFTISASDGKIFGFAPRSQYYRLVYTNGNVNQGLFRLQIIAKSTTMRGSSHRIGDNVSGEDDAELTKTVLTGENPGGTYVNFQATTQGNFKVSVEEVNGVEMPVKGTTVHDDPDDGDAPIKQGGKASTSVPTAVADGDIVNAYFDDEGFQRNRPSDPRLDVSQGKVPGQSFILKFGENPDIDIASGFEDIWDGGGSYVPPTVARVHDVASNDANDAGSILSSGTATGGSLTTLVDTGATFVTDTVAVGDIVLNDSNVELGTVTGVTETTLTMAGSMRSPNSGDVGTANATSDSYRVVTQAPAQTGASIFHILGLDASFLQIEEFVVLNGTNNVATSSSYIRQFRARVFGPSTTGAVGTITSTAQTDGTVSCQIIDGNNQTLMAIYTVPSNKKGYLTKWWATLSKKKTVVCDVHLRAGTLDGIGYLLQTRAVDNGGNSTFTYDYPYPQLIPGGSDIWIEANTDADDTAVAAGFDILLVDA